MVLVPDIRPEPFSASTVEMVCRAVAEAVTGSQIPNLSPQLNMPEPPSEERVYIVTVRPLTVRPNARWSHQERRISWMP